MRRRTYWLLVLLVALGVPATVVVSRSVLDVVDEWRFALLPAVYVLVVALPSMLVATARRMHDIDRSAWFALVPLVNLVLAARPGTRGPNRFGEDPRGPARHPDVSKTFE